MKKKVKIAYIFTRFPCLTELFALREVEELRRLGIDVQPYSLKRVQAEEMQDPLMKFWFDKTIYVPSSSSFQCLVSLSKIGIKRFKIFWGDLIVKCISGNIRNLRYLFASLAVFSQATHITQELVKTNVMWIHAHFATNATTVAWIIKHLSGIPYSFTPHAYDIFKREFQTGFLRTKIQDAHFVVAVSQFNKFFLQNFSGQKSENGRYPVIHYGIGSDYLHRQLKKDCKNQFPIILCIARLVEKKGHKYLIRALDIIKQQALDFKCIMVGDGPLQEQLINQIEEKKLEDRVEFVGKFSQVQVKDILEQADIFCLPCIHASSGDRDGIPVALMEAMAKRLPVISTHMKGITELIKSGDNGLLVPERDEKALADALITLLKNANLRSRLAEAGYNTIHEYFNSKKETTKLYQIFLKQLKKNTKDDDTKRVWA